MTQLPFATHDLTQAMYPMVMLWFDADWRILHSETVDGPGVVHVRKFGKPMGTQTVFGNGWVVVTPVPPQEIFEAAKTGGHMVIRNWLSSRCGADDEANRIGSCPLDRGHPGSCEIKFFIPGQMHVGRVVFNSRPVEDTQPI